MLAELHLAEGSFPFKYLGVPLSTRKITIAQCMPLVERIVDRIRSWTSKFLSYAGRLQLIKSVLFEIQTYWAQVFFIPKKVIKLINGICRNYLWTGSHDTSHRVPIAWETLCKPETAGGINIIDYERWNKAALTKLLWVIMSKKDKLWIKWIHCHYIKKKDITTMEIPRQASLLVRKLFTAREWWANDFTRIQTCTQNGKFSIRKACLHTTPQYPKVHWKILVMVTGMLPKHKYILRKAMHRRLATFDRLAKWGVQVDQSCTLCGRDIEETHDHLYFECSYSQSLWKGILRWLEYQRTTGKWETKLQWLIANVNNRNLRKALLEVVFAVVVYNIWMERNDRRFQQLSREAKDRAKEIALQVQIAGQKKPKWSSILQSFNSYPTCNPRHI
ncbi:uncharacterized protein LOC142165733 [Nicotiana tabacum]|uniref:Uncharacterized protein LOC142165733 n=1 Tax=Nicotiana tabacum TaxID=4097 RepID=A0AC58S5C5_TOBAC